MGSLGKGFGRGVGNESERLLRFPGYGLEMAEVVEFIQSADFTFEGFLSSSSFAKPFLRWA